MDLQRLLPETVPADETGFTILETLIAVSISSIIFILVLFVYNAYAKMTHAQESQSEVQRQLMMVRCLVEKDVRMSGFNLPGNGLFPMNYGSGDFKLVFLRNEDNKKTVLDRDAVGGDSLIVVTDGHGVSAKQWLCLERGGSLAYYQIARVGLHSGMGCDTMKLKDSTVSVFWDKSATKVYFAKGVYYGLAYVNAARALMRHAFESDLTIGPSIDSISYVPTDASGILLGNLFDQAQTLQITLGGRSPKAPANSRFMKTFDAMIRN